MDESKLPKLSAWLELMRAEIIRKREAERQAHDEQQRRERELAARVDPPRS
jgi:hypothetical protein